MQALSQLSYGPLFGLSILLLHVVASLLVYELYTSRLAPSEKPNWFGQNKTRKIDRSGD